MPRTSAISRAGVCAQHVLRDVAERDLSATFLGAKHALPLMLGPVGFLGMFGRRGEVAAARAAGRAGVPSCVSAFAIRPIDEVARDNPETVLYSQLYVLKDRVLTEAMIARAEAAGADALFLTVDTAVTPLRERDARNGFRNLTRPTLGQWRNIISRPAWCWAMIRDGRPEVGHAREAGFGRGVMEQAGHLARQIDPALNWADVDWLRRRWTRKLVIKGIMEPEDARRAAEAGRTALSSPIMAAASWTAPPPPSWRCPPSARRSAASWMCWLMAASAVAGISRWLWRWARRPFRWAAPMPGGWLPAERRVSRMRSVFWRLSWTARWL